MRRMSGLPVTRVEDTSIGHRGVERDSEISVTGKCRRVRRRIAERPAREEVGSSSLSGRRDGLDRGRGPAGRE
jgi:hypothetical protein